MSFDDTREIPVQRSAPPERRVVDDTSQQGDASSDAAEADIAEITAAMRALAWKTLGFVFGLALLVACSFAVGQLQGWGERYSLPLVFLLFTAAMLVASQFTVGGARAIWAAIRTPARK